MNVFGFADDGAAFDLAETVVRDGLGLAKLAELSDKPSASDPSISAKKDGYLKDSLYQSDGGAPLLNPKHERFLELYLDTGRREVAYRSCVSSNCSRESAIQQASRLLARVEVRARLRFLMQARKTATKPPEPGGRRMSRVEKLVELERIIHSGGISVADRVRAIQEHNRLMAAGRAGAAGVPDPAFLAEFMRKAGKTGKAPDALAREIKGDDDAGKHEVAPPGGEQAGLQGYEDAPDDDLEQEVERIRDNVA
jgi:hypothetical protein